MTHYWYQKSHLHHKQQANTYLNTALLLIYKNGLGPDANRHQLNKHQPTLYEFAQDGYEVLKSGQHQNLSNSGTLHAEQTAAGGLMRAETVLVDNLTFKDLQNILTSN